MERDETGRRWIAGYLHTPEAQAAVKPLTCPDHPGVQLLRILGRAWTCPRCLHASQQPPPDTA